MLISISRFLGMSVALLVAALVLQWLVRPAGADERADLDAALKAATAQYQAARNTLENRGREDTAAEVARFRAAFPRVIDLVEANRAAFPGEDSGRFMQVDARIVGAMVVIDIGSREAALAPIKQTLSELSLRSAPAE